MSDSRPRVLFLSYGPLQAAQQERFAMLGELCRGDIIAPAGGGDADVVLGALRCHTYGLAHGRTLWHSMLNVLRCIRLGRQLARDGRYDIVIACGLFRTALAGWLLARLERSKLLVEVPVLPREIVLHRDPSKAWRKRIKAWWLGQCAALLLARADHLKCIFPAQAIAISPRLSTRSVSAFSDFVAVSRIEASSTDDGSIILLGTPLYLKGADIAIQAFRQIMQNHPGKRLRIIGSAQGFKHLSPWIRAGDPIELIDYMPHAQAIAELRKAVLVLIPSRTDAMPRVAIEAMAAGKAVIASAVDGMPHYLRDLRNCLMVPPGDCQALAARMDLVLRSAELRRRLGERARLDALAQFGEIRYADHYRRMLYDCLAGRPGHCAGYLP